MGPMPHFNAIHSRPFKAIIISTCAARWVYAEHGTPSTVSIFFLVGGKFLYNIVLVSAYTNYIYMPSPLSLPSLPPTPPARPSSQSIGLGSLWYTVALHSALLSRFSRVQLCATPETAAHQTPPSLGFSRQEHWSGLPFPSPMHESEKWKWSCSLVSNS